MGLIKIAIILGIALTCVPILVICERRLSARMQLRYGPTLVGLPKLGILGPLKGFHLWGLLQPIADVVKLVFKENFVPATSEKMLYRLAPAMVFVPTALALAGIPFMGNVAFTIPLIDVPVDLGRLIIFDSEIGILFVLAATSLGVHGLTMAGWSSNNKFSQMGGIRASAQLISYEAPMFIALLAALMMTGSTSFFDIVDYQASQGWLFWQQPLAFVIFIVCAFAETNRAPFDMPECEPELVGGYHTEYGGMRFAMFFMGEYVAMFNQCAVIVLVFLGGWTLPNFLEWFVPATGAANPEGVVAWIHDAHTELGGLAGVGIFLAKTITLLVVMVWVRWTIPRFRYDQLMTLGWKRLTPLAMLNLAATAVIGVWIAGSGT